MVKKSRKKKGHKKKARKRGQSLLQRLLPLWVVLGLGLAGLFAYVITRTSEGDEQTAVCGLVIDRTGSFIAPGTPSAEKYRDIAYSVVDRCRDANARLAIFWFDSGGTKLEQVGDSYELRLKDGVKESAQKDALDETIADAKRAIDSVFEQKSVNADDSDILSAVKVAAGIISDLAAEDGVDTRYLVLISNGLQATADVSMTGIEETEAPDRFDALVEQTKQLSLVPTRLSGTKVSFFGAMTGQYEGNIVPGWFESEMRNFWDEVVDAGGGTLCQFQPEATAQTVLSCQGVS